MNTTSPRPHRRDGRSRFLPFLLIALAFHLVLLLTSAWWFPKPKPVEPTPAVILLDPAAETPPPTRVAPEPEQNEVIEPLEQPEPEPEPEEPPPPPPEDAQQIVEIAKPEVEERPDLARYLAEYNSRVPKQTRSAEFEINPDVLAPEKSSEARERQEEVKDVNRPDPSEGSPLTPPAQRFDPNRDGQIRDLPNLFDATNREGHGAPMASAEPSTQSGAPQNDLLREELGDRVALNAFEMKFANYLNKIRRAVNFYWKQNIDNLPSGTSLTQNAYTTGVSVILDTQGRISSIGLTRGSGSQAFDSAVLQAFRLASPFPEPPPDMAAEDGRIYLPGFSFTVQITRTMSAPSIQFDPRAGVQFPGLQTPMNPGAY